MHKKIYAAIIGMKYYPSSLKVKVGDPVFLVKDPDNLSDPEAIRVVLPSHGQVGYIANNSTSVPRGCRSAGRIYDSFRQQTLGVVQFIFHDIAIIELKEVATKPGAEEKEVFIMYRTPSEQL
ncbi:HIRAN domain-containing protein [Paenibacillus gallinarum]|uniref:HIRAN domain-containing protein n=1 Tax=Paenibacillus gallinarum TaxID=2762232 RepID=A0ABR8SVG8_9BACL|nr:HIRAN domain-containing protein [Paenibacillus gallinarum]MBD7967488.1 HIRAN domain-containing protein [Paenibacillus gallinarum]